MTEAFPANDWLSASCVQSRRIGPLIRPKAGSKTVALRPRSGAFRLYLWSAVLLCTLLVSVGAGAATPFSSQDIGSVGAAGSYAVSGGTHTLVGSGANIWDAADEFRFAYQSLSGDGQITARVVSLTNSNPWAKAGVMIRESLAADSRHSSIVIFPENGLRLVYRTTTGGSSAPDWGYPDAAVPHWVRIARQGNQLSTYSSTDGLSWTFRHSVTIALPTSVYIGLVVTSRDDGVLATAVFDNVSVSTGIDSEAPTAPSGFSATAVSSSRINLSWTASTDNVGVSSYVVERCQGTGCSNYVQVATPSSNSYSDTGLAASTTYLYRVKALDAAGNSSSYSGSSSATTTSSGNAPTNGLWLHHRYNESSGTTASDASGNGHNATLYSGATWAAGQTGNALSLDGTNDYALVQTSDLNQITNAVTMSAWVNLNAQPTDWNGQIVSRQSTSAPGYEYYALGLDHGGKTPRFLLSTNGDVSCHGSALSTGTWHHLAGVYDGTTMKLYVNSALVCTKAYSGTFASDNTPLVISGNVNTLNGPVQEHVSGRIDNLRIYSRALTATEVALLTSEDNADSQAPTAPSGLSATAASSSQINLTWTASTDNLGVTVYVVERCLGAGCSNFVPVATPSSASYSDTGLAASTTYLYRVKALDAAGNSSSYSSSSSGTTTSSGGGGGDTQAPTAPASASATAQSGTQILVSWSVSTDNVGIAGYKVERCLGASCTNFAQIATPTGTSLVDTGLTGSTAYRYRVRAYDAAGNHSGYSPIASATTNTTPDTQAPTAPSNLTVTPGTTTMALSWTASTDNVGVTGYLIERCQGSGCTSFTQIGTSTTANYQDTGLLAGIPYGYRVRARDAAGNLSAYSGGGVGVMGECD